jgi:phage host-nuclease inhibitor protein Gam
MSKNRIKKSLQFTVQTREDAEARMNDLAVAANTRVSLIADMDAQILAIKQQYESDIATQDAFIKAASDDLEAWALANPDLFQKPKSLSFLSGVMGFRTGTPKLALLNRKWNWDLVLDMILKCGFAFVRTKPEVDKEAILAFYSEATDKAPVQEKVLTPIGLKVVQDEGFYIEPKLTKQEVAA